MSSIQPFDFEGTPVRTITYETGLTWWVLTDVAKSLGVQNATDLANRLDEDERSRFNLGRQGEAWIVNESGLYKIILRSDKPEAKEFQRWVTHEVLPSIRRHGGYMAGQESMSPEQMALASMRWLQSKVAEQATQLEEQRPKVLFADSVAASQSSILVGQLAKIIQQNGADIGQRRLFAWMRSNHYLSGRKGEDYNMPLQRYVEQGLFQIKESTHTNPDGVTFTTRTVKVTGKGQTYIIDRFLDRGMELAK